MVRSSAAIAIALTGALFGCDSQPVTAPNPGATRPSAPPVPIPDEKSKILQVGLPLQTVILTYHDMVQSRNRDALWFDCTPDELEDQIALFRNKGFRFVSLQQVVDRLTGNSDSYPARAVAITFADNYQGYFRWAEPILARENIPVTLFVHTGHVGSQKNRPKMSWLTLKSLQKTGRVSVQSQTVSHPADLTQLTDEQLKAEFLNSRSDIIKNLNVEAAYLAYPNGKFNARIMDSARTFGYLCGYTEEQEPAEAAKDLLAIPRYVHTEYQKAIRDVTSKKSP